MSPRAFERPRKNARGDPKTQSTPFARSEHLFPRQDVIKCQTGIGRGDCVEVGSCRGFYETDRNLCPQGDGPRECCLLHRCSVAEGSGFCQSTIGRRCEKDGKYFEGTGPPWPCIGPNDVQCCVQNENINTGSSTSALPSTTSSTTSSSLTFTTSSTPSLSTTTNPPISNTATPTNSQPPSAGSGGLSSGAKGGIAGGVVAGVLIMGLIAALFFVLGKQRNAKKEASAAANARPPTPTAAEKRQEENTMTEKDDDTYGKPEFLGGSPLSELPADPLTGELDSQVKGERTKDNSVEKIFPTAQKRSRGAVELSTNTSV